MALERNIERLTPPQTRMVRVMQAAPERPLSIRRLERQRMKTANALCDRGLLRVKAFDGIGVDFVLTEEGRGAE